MTIKIQGTNSTAAPGITGGDTDTGVQFGTNEVKIVTGGSDRVTVASNGNATFVGNVQSGGDPTTSSPAAGAVLRATGLVSAARASGSNIFSGFTTGNNTPTSLIKSDGSATFGGAVQSGGDPNDGTAVGAKMLQSGVVQAARASGSGASAVYMGYLQGTATPTSRINADGSAVFDSYHHIKGHVRIDGGGDFSSTPAIELLNDGRAVFADGKLTISDKGNLSRVGTGGNYYNLGAFNNSGTTSGAAGGRLTLFTDSPDGTPDVQTIALNGLDGTAEFTGAVKVGGTAAANQIDEYEQGTFTPFYESGVTSPGYTNTSANYVRIGQLVTFTIRINASSGTNASARVEIGGLPFTASNTAKEGGAWFSYYHGLDGNNHGPSLLINDTTTKIVFYTAAGGNWAGTDGSGIVGKTFHIAGQYFV